ncbi:hypothetical protein KM043_007030 [Ampulex compressa]|nr:hypothetical protein KM043_007030 [Ampulex compressa]
MHRNLLISMRKGSPLNLRIAWNSPSDMIVKFCILRLRPYLGESRAYLVGASGHLKKTRFGSTFGEAALELQRSEYTLSGKADTTEVSSADASEWHATISMLPIFEYRLLIHDKDLSASPDVFHGFSSLKWARIAGFRCGRRNILPKSRTKFDRERTARRQACEGRDSPRS